jgi:hypothetical protein
LDELAYALITPYSILKSRTGGIIGRLIAHSRLTLLSLRMFVFSDEFVNAFSAKMAAPGMDPAMAEAWKQYLHENLSPEIGRAHV